jgi:hypothetical protein
MYVGFFLVTAAICDGGGVMGVTLCEQHDCYMLRLHSLVWDSFKFVVTERDFSAIQRSGMCVSVSVGVAC